MTKPGAKSSEVHLEWKTKDGKVVAKDIIWKGKDGTLKSTVSGVKGSPAAKKQPTSTVGTIADLKGRWHKISAAARAAFVAYTSSSSWANDHLRSSHGQVHITSTPHGVSTAERIKAMDEAMQPIGAAKKLYRGMRLWELTDNPDDDIEGLQFSRHGFSSYSTSKSTAQSFAGGGEYMVELEVPPSVRVQFLGGVGSHPSENEMLLERGLRFEIVRREGGNHIVVRVIGRMKPGENPYEDAIRQRLLRLRQSGRTSAQRAADRQALIRLLDKKEHLDDEILQQEVQKTLADMPI
jgi:hypothetical protein